MVRQSEAKGQGGYLRAVLLGTVGAALFLGLLLLAAGLSETRSEIMELRRPIVKACLLVSALAGGALAGYRAGQGRLAHALCGEGALVLVLVICAASGRNEAHFMSLLLDLLFVLFGAFAGTLLGGKRKNKRRGKR